MAKQKQLACFLDERIGNPFKEDVMVSVAIHDVPSRLLKEFMQKVVWERYEGGISPAIRHLMWLAVQKKQRKTGRTEHQGPKKVNNYTGVFMKLIRGGLRDLESQSSVTAT